MEDFFPDKVKKDIKLVEFAWRRCLELLNCLLHTSIIWIALLFYRT